MRFFITIFIIFALCEMQYADGDKINADWCVLLLILTLFME